MNAGEVNSNIQLHIRGIELRGESSYTPISILPFGGSRMQGEERPG